MDEVERHALGQLRMKLERLVVPTPLCRWGPGQEQWSGTGAWTGVWTDASHRVPRAAAEFHTPIHSFICSTTFKEHLLVPVTFQAYVTRQGTEGRKS